MTITPPRGTPGSARTASRNRRRRPQPGEPRHAANAPAFEEAPAARRRTTRPPAEGPGELFAGDVEEVRTDPADLPPEGLGARLYEVMSDSERETAVAETLLFVAPAFDDEPPAGTHPVPPVTFTDTDLASTELAIADVAGTDLASADPVSADPLGVEARPPLSEPESAGIPVPPAETVLFARPADLVRAAPPVRREVTPLTETFLFGTPPARHAQEPRSPIDGTAETLLFAGLARALATAEEEPADSPEARWDMSSGAGSALTTDHATGGRGWAGTPYRRAWDVLDRNAAQPLPEDERTARRGWRRRDRKAAPEELATGAAGLGRPGRLVNRKRSRSTDFDHDVPAPEEAWIPAYPQVDEQPWHGSLPEDAKIVGVAEVPEVAEGPAAPAAGWVAEDQAEFDASWVAEDSAAPVPAEPEDEDPFGARRTLSPEAEAAWRAFADGDREPGTEIRTNRRARSRWLTSLSGEQQPAEKPKRRIFLMPVILRCLLYLGPVSVAVAGAGALARVAWPVAAGTLLLGWSAAQALTSMGVTVARRAGPEAAVRLIGAGFAAVTALWCALVWISPGELLGPDRLLAASVGAGGLATLATVTAALVARAESAVILWYLPCWLLAAAALAGDAGMGWAHWVPVETLLPATVVTVLVRAFRPAVVPGRRCRIPRLTAVERRRGIAYLVIGVSQALCVALLWQAGPDVTPSLVALPLLLAVPMLEALIGWHTARIDAGLDSAQSVGELDRHVRNVTAITLAGLLPPLAAGGALALAAYRLPYQLSHLGATQPAVLALAAGTLLGGVFAITFLLAARSRTGIAATLAAAPSLATLALPLLPQPDAGPLPLAVAVLAATHVAGLLIVALTAADLRRTS
ncbi:hypothetical protein Acy02nite_54940 [Actinoplanes cyaneus]|uniref:Uncharacterized protein n=1 Tax=Actinoplanes cyaneus TaxID=52696 RepID=A0A919M7R5_9ACTN|nr:hypothetical protein [Actinoplanes cyaneus]MCW2140428.1 hypothetical protein [Actinoplanes cyaneus]GID67613.1 hypothetical protein Acy02nite_54940 [Actinoplanes cyaneus]